MKTRENEADPDTIKEIYIYINKYKTDLFKFLDKNSAVSHFCFGMALFLKCSLI